ncbi:MAG: ABC transporter permease [Fidelibacterota bacterium]|nr:MAG: ABC transporter permease [Candidatus Neomarinimicrobiota bacterium]
MINTGFLTFVWRELKRFLSLYNQTLVPGLLTTVLYVVVFGKSLGGRIGEIKEVPYMSFIIPGLAMMNVITNAYSNSASSLFQAKIMKFMDDILITPLSGLEISVGYIIGGMARGVLNGILVLLLGMLLTGTTVAHPLLVLVFLLVVGWAFGAAGLLVGIYAKSFENIQVLVNFFFTPLVFLGGVFYSIDMLPPVWRDVSLFNPLYYMINGLRYAVLDVADSSPWWSLVVSIFAAVLFTSAGSILFARGYRIKE